MSRSSYSIINRLTGLYVLSLFVLVVFLSSFLYWSLSRTLSEEDNAFLRNHVRVLTTLLGRDQDALQTTRTRVELEWAARRERRIYVRILDPSGRTLVESPQEPPDVTLEVYPKARLQGLEDNAAKGTRVRTSSGGEYLVLAKAVSLAGGSGGSPTVYMALDLAEEERLLGRYRVTALSAIVISLLLAGLLGRRLAITAFKPLERMAHTTQRIHSSTLHERLPEADLPLELRMLAGTVNGMLERLEGSFERLSRFSADIAHELRTPINNIRGEVEVALSKPRDPGEYYEVLGSSLEELGRISKIIDSLLFVAQAENPEMQITREKVELRGELALLIEFFEAPAAEAGIDIRLDAAESLVLAVERTLFQRAVGNILSNAINHTRPPGSVTIRAFSQANKVIVSISDTGEGIASKDLPLVFDRFYRADPSRNATRLGGFGLGLTIAKSIVALHDGNIRIESKVGKGTTVYLEFPSATVLS